MDTVEKVAAKEKQEILQKYSTTQCNAMLYNTLSLIIQVRQKVSFIMCNLRHGRNFKKKQSAKAGRLTHIRFPFFVKHSSNHRHSLDLRE